MRTSPHSAFLAFILLSGLAVGSAFGATTIISDDYTVTTTTTGFTLNNGVNFGIQPPTTRLTGSAAANLRYIRTGTRPGGLYSIDNNKLQANGGGEAGRFTLGANSSTPYDFASALGAGSASPGNPAVYDIAISIVNYDNDNDRASFGFGTVEGDVTTWDFGIQLYQTAGDTKFSIGKLIDEASSDLASDLKEDIAGQKSVVNVDSEVSFLIRVFDAGAESSTFGSRVLVSKNGGSSWIYDTTTDPALINGWRFDAGGRYIIWDQAPNADKITYDAFSVVLFPEKVWSGGGDNNNWGNTGGTGNWVGTIPPRDGDSLVFTGTTRQANNNNLGASTLTLVPSVTFNNGGFTLSGNPLTVTRGITSVAGANTMNNALTLNNASSISTESGVLTLGGNLTGTGSVAKSGAGTLILGGANTYDGNTTVSVGTLLVNGSIGSGATTVANGATLGGAGTIGGTVAVQPGGTLAPGDNAIGTLTINNTLTLNADGTTAMEIKTVSGTCSSDQVAGATAVTAAGALNVTLDGASDPLAGGESFTLFNLAPTETFASANLPSLGAGLNWWTPNNYATITVNRAPIAEHKTCERTKDMTVKIYKAGLMAGASDPDSGDSAAYDGLVSLTSEQGVTVAEDQTFYYYVPINDNDDQLQYKVKDNRGGLTTRYIYINVTPMTGQVQAIEPVGGQATVRFAGIPGERYDVQRATDVDFEENLTTLLSTNAPLNGVFLLVEPMLLPQAYYRLKYPGTPPAP